MQHVNPSYRAGDRSGGGTGTRADRKKVSAATRGVKGKKKKSNLWCREDERNGPKKEEEDEEEEEEKGRRGQWGRVSGKTRLGDYLGCGAKVSQSDKEKKRRRRAARGICGRRGQWDGGKRS